MEGKVGNGRWVSGNERGAELPDIFLIDDFSVVKAFDIGGHRGVDSGVKLAQERHQTVANLVTAGVEFGIGAVLDIFQMILGNIGVDFSPAERQQRTDN